jgi:autotransporter-associated beta strand protein
MTMKLKAALAAVASLLVLTGSAQTLVITNGVQTYATLASTTVTMSNRCELRVTATNAPLTGCLINLNSVDAYLVLPGIKPSTVVSTYLSQVRINGAAAVADSNCRVVEYAMGAIILPHASSLQPLTVFSAPYFNGASLALSQYTYYKSGLGAMYAKISSFKLKRGYMAVLAQTENGTGLSKSYVAQDGDMEVSVLPAEFNNSVRFVYVTPWRWSSKKGTAGNPGNNLLNVQSWYNWNIDQNSTRDLEYVPIRQQRWWPDLASQNWQSRGANTVLGYNEPDHTDQANMTVGDAIYSWPDLLYTGLRVGSPAPSDGGYSSWLYPFIAQADAANLRVDFVAAHYYRCFNPADPNGAATQMYNALKGIYDTTKRPLWVTEWNNGANWTTCADPTYAQQQACVAAILNMLDTTPFVERYQIYNWVEDVRAVTTNGVLTGAGVTYRDQQSPIGYVQALQGNGTRSFTQLRFETNTLDTSGYGNNGLSAGSPAYTNGQSGQAIVFDGANTVVTLPPNVASNNAFTFAAWIKWDGGANWQRIFDFGNSTTHYMFLTPNNGSVMRFAIANGGSEQRVDAAVLPQNQWQHVALTLSGSTARLYTNGVLAAQNTGMSITPASFAPRINRLGKSQFYADPLFKGALDDVLITDYALSAAQIAALQTNTPPQFTNSLFARGTGTEGIAYNNTLAGAATDADPGDTLTFSKAVGPAWLNVAANGTLTGTPTSADGGTNYFTMAVTDAAGQNGYAVVTVVVTTLTSSGTWTSDASANWGDTSRWSGNVVASGVGQTASFSTINISANRTVTLDTSRAISTLRFSDITATFFNWTITNSADSTLTLNSGSAASPAIVVTNTATLAAPLAGTNGYTKSGPGTLILSGNNSLSGTVNIDTANSSANDGITRLVGPGALGNVSLLQIGNNNSGFSTLQLDGSAGSIGVNATVSVTCRNSGVVTIENLAGTNIFNGDILLNVGGNTHTVQSDAGLLVFTGTNRYVGTLTGGRTYFFTGAGNHLLVGPVINSTNGAPIALAKSGTGALILESVNTYTNGTTLSGGTLIVNGSLPAGSFTISSGTKLGGSGTIYPAVTLPAGATLIPGNNLGITQTNNNGGGGNTNNNSAVGVLTINNSATLQAGSACLFEIDKSADTINDKLIVTGTLTLGGTLTVTNIGVPLAAGDTFQLFVAGGINNNFASVKLPALGVGLAWNTNSITSGILSVVATAKPQFSTIAQAGDGNFQFTGTGAAGVLYELDAATDLSVPITWLFVTNMVADQAGFFQLVDLSATNYAQRFYRISGP